MTATNISHYFSEFEPSNAQLRKLGRLLKKVHKSWGIEYGDSVLEATLLLAPGELSQLTPAAYDLLQRCQTRVWEFKVQVQQRYGVYHKETYQELFDSLLSLGLIEESTTSQKLNGSKKVDELRTLLRSRGLPHKGKKDVLVQRIVENLPREETDALVDGVLLFRTTDGGDRAIQTIGELLLAVQLAFENAVIGTMDQFRNGKESSPKLPPGVLYDDGEVRITEEDVEEAIRAWDHQALPEFVGILRADVEESTDTDSDREDGNDKEK